MNSVSFAQPQRIVIASDHAGYSLKKACHEALLSWGYEVLDLGCHGPEDKVDYPAIAEQVARTLQRESIACALITCGSGVGVAMAANRFPWVRAAHVHDETLARLSRGHNNANILCMGGRFVAPVQGVHLLQCWLNAPYEGERHDARVNLLNALVP
jgi:ribose 5-phosphate isomerase B